MRNVLLIINHQFTNWWNNKFSDDYLSISLPPKTHILISHHYFCPGRTQFSLIITNKINNRIQNIHTRFIWTNKIEIISDMLVYVSRNIIHIRNTHDRHSGRFFTILYRQHTKRQNDNTYTGIFTQDLIE